MRSGDRDAAALFLSDYGDLIRRRVRGKLGASMRRVFDSQDILSTVSRRLDRYVRNGRLQATTEQQLWSLIFRIAEAAVIDKVRVVKRLLMAEGEDGPIARHLLDRLSAAEDHDDGTELALERVYFSLRSDADREMLALWLSDTPLFRIADVMGCTPAAARQRWKGIRDQLRELIQTGEL